MSRASKTVNKVNRKEHNWSCDTGMQMLSALCVVVARVL